MPPAWLHVVSVVALVAAFASAAIIFFDIVFLKHRQKMAVMNIVWPITGLYFSVVAVWAYFRFGRAEGEKPFWQTTAVATTHCGAGCTLGDLIGEWLVFGLGFTVASSTLAADYVADLLLAYLIGIAFQYFSIAPMKNLHGLAGVKAAAKADAISIAAFEIGMFAWMAFTHFVLFRPPLEPDSAVYWFMMQIAMVAGFLTSFPANWWLVRKGIKEAM